MSTTSLRARAEPWSGLWRAAPALIAGTLALLALFHEEAAAAVAVWDESTAYGHCYFVLPIALYILWDRRERLRAVEARPVAWLLVGMIPLGLVWLLAERLGIMEGRQLMAMSMLQLLFLAVLGWRSWWLMSAGLLYLYFLVPFGAFVTVPLQHFTAHFIEFGLNLLGIPNYVDNFLIDIPEGRFFVAEACAGLRFLIAAVAFGVLYSVLIYRSPWKRVCFMLASFAIPIIANGFRALGIVVLGHILGSAQAAAADHIIYGWLFFSVVILLLILAGMPFREDMQPLRAPVSADPSPAAARGPIWLVAAVACALAVLAPAAATALDRRADHVALAALPQFRAVSPCAPAPHTAPAAAPAPIRGEVTTWRCGAMMLEATVLAFPPHSTMGPVRAIQHRLGVRGEEVDGGRLKVPGGSPATWPARFDPSQLRASASMVWIDGEPMQGGLAGRFTQLRNSVLGSDFAPVLMVVAVTPADAAGRVHEPARRLLARFLAAQHDLPALIRRFARASARPAVSPPVVPGSAAATAEARPTSAARR